MESFGKWILVIREAGLLGLLVLILIGGFKKWWVFGWIHDGAIARLLEELKDAKCECDEWRKKFIELAERHHDNG